MFKTVGGGESFKFGMVLDVFGDARIVAACIIVSITGILEHGT